MRILVFGHASDLVGSKEIEIVTPDELSIDELKQALIKKYPALNDIEGLLIAVNNEYSYNNLKKVKASDEVALIPPTSGG